MRDRARFSRRAREARRSVYLGLLAFGLVMTGLILGMALFPRSGSGPLSEGPHRDRFVHAATLARALHRYSLDHDGRIPEHLGELTPNYIPTNEAVLLEGPRRALALGGPSPAGIGIAIGGSETTAAYLYFPTQSVSLGIILTERPGIWRLTGQPRLDGGVYVIRPDFGFELWPTQQLIERLQMPVLGEDRK